MDIKSRVVSGVTIFAPTGKLVLGDGDGQLRDAVREALNGGSKKIVLNLRDVTYIDSSGLGVMISSHTTASQNNAKLKMTNIPQKILDLLYITKLITVFETSDTEDEAVKSFA